MQSIRTNNCYCFQPFSYKIIANNKNKQHYQSLKMTTFKPLDSNPKIAFGFCQPVCDARLTKNQTDDKKSSIGKRALQIGALSLVVLPAKGLLSVGLTDELPSKVDTVIASKELVVATVADDSTLFREGELVHGFGYDVAKRYAQHLGVTLHLQSYDDQQSMIEALANGDVDMVLGSNLQADTTLSNPIACDGATKDKLQEHGLDTEIGFTFLANDKSLIDHSQNFLCSQETLAQSRAVARFYDQTLLKNAYSQRHFEKALTQKLPMYEHAFKQGASKYNHDWQVLAVVSYQESHLNPDAISPTGVQGLMMLTNETAKEMGVTDRTDALQSIQGGAKYLEVVDKQFLDIPKDERLWFVLAAYNMGPNAVKRIQNELNTQGKDGNSWSEVYTYLTTNADKNSRYVQCMHYVSNIRTYLETIKTMQA